MLGLTVACALVAGFTGPHASRVMPRSRACMMSDEEPAAPTPMAPSFTLSTEGITLKEQYAKDFASMGGIGAYMSIREEMAKAFNAADTDGDGKISQAELGNLLANLGEEVSDAVVAEQFAAADTGSRGFIIFEQWCKEFLAYCKPTKEG